MHVVNPCDPEKRLDFCHRFLNAMDIHSILSTDEAVFSSYGAEKQQCWAASNPRRRNASRKQHGAKLMVRVRLTGRRIVVPFLFSPNVTGRQLFRSTNALRLLASSCKELMQNCVIPELEAAGLLSTVWLRQNGASAHYAKTV